MTLPTSKYIAPTEDCFRHFMSEHPQLQAAELLAEFCLPGAKGAAVASVQAWQRGVIDFPRGDALLRLRCFLTLVGYEVTEFAQLEGIVRQLAMMISMGRIKPVDAASKLGFQSPNHKLHSLWQITLGKRGFTTTTRKALVRLVRRPSSKVDDQMAVWRERIIAVIGEPEVTLAEEKPDLQEILMPVVTTSFGRMAAALTPMAQSLLRSDRPQAVRDATRNGAVIDELIEALSKLRESL